MYFFVQGSFWKKGKNNLKIDLTFLLRTMDLVGINYFSLGSLNKNTL